MRAILVLDEPLSAEAKRIEDFEEALYVAAATDTAVTVEVQPEGYRLISESKTVSEPVTLDSSTVRAEIMVGHLPNLGKLVARYGGAAKVIAPAEARAVVKNYALAALGEDTSDQIENED